MGFNVDLKNRVVDFFNVDTGQVEKDIVKYLDKQMKVRLHSAVFQNKKYVFTGNSKDYSTNSITISGYRKRTLEDKFAIEIS